MCLLSVSPTGLSAFCLPLYFQSQALGKGSANACSWVSWGQDTPNPGPVRPRNPLHPRHPRGAQPFSHVPQAASQMSPHLSAAQPCHPRPAYRPWPLCHLPTHRCLGRAGDPERPVPHHSPKPLTPGSSPGLNLQGCRRNPILATKRRQPPWRHGGMELPCKRPQQRQEGGLGSCRGREGERRRLSLEAFLTTGVS